MVILQYKTLSFAIVSSELQVKLLKLFVTTIPITEVTAIAPFTVVDQHTLQFVHSDQDKTSRKFSFILEKYFACLTNALTGNTATYIHQNSGIPLIGNVAFGIVYRNSSIIEIKPMTSCNLDCIYCSISEGLSSKKHDFVVEKDYLLEELQKLLNFVNEPVEIHIGVQGEPFLYEDMIELIADLQQLSQIHTISIDTNGTLLSRPKINLLAANSKLQLNLSLDAIDPVKAKEIAGVDNYNLEHVKSVIAYASEKLKVIVAPVFTDGYNNQEMDKIMVWVKTLPKQPILGLQNFLRYKTGRHPAREVPWLEFYQMLEKLEQKHHIKLKLSREDFKIQETRPLPKPFAEGDTITAVIKCQDRFNHSVIAAAKDRNISIPNCNFMAEKKVKVKIMRDKHNIFTGKLL